MAQDQSLADFFEQCEHLAALWRFDQIIATSEEVIFEDEDEDNFVQSFLRFCEKDALKQLSAKQRDGLTVAMERVTDAMLEALKVPKIGTRLRMIRLLGRLGIGKALNPLLLILQKAESSYEREVAANALGQLGQPAAGDALRCVVSDKQLSPSLRSSAINALARSTPCECVETITEVFAEDDRLLCRRGAECLLQAEVDNVLPAITHKWADNILSSFGRLRVASLVIRLNDIAKTKRDTSEFERFIKSSIKADDTDVAWDAITIAVELGLPCKEELFQAAWSGVENVREIALESLGKLGARTRLRECLPMISDKTLGENVRKAAAKAAVAVGLDKELAGSDLKDTVHQLLSMSHHIKYTFVGPDGVERDIDSDESQHTADTPVVDKDPILTVEHRGDVAVRMGRFESIRACLPLEQFINNFPADTSRLSPTDLDVRDILKIAKMCEKGTFSIAALKARVSEIQPEANAVFELLRVSEDLFSDSYTGALAVSELAYYAAKEFSAADARMFLSLLIGRICLDLELNDGVEQQIELLIQPFGSLLERAFAAYLDSAESHHILRTYFTLNEELDKRINRDVESAASFFHKQSDCTGRFFILKPNHVFRTLIEKIEANAPGNTAKPSRSGSILQLSDTACRISLWAQRNTDIIAKGDISEVRDYLSQSTADDAYRRSINVVALGEGLFEGGQFQVAAEVLAHAERALSAIHQEPHAWHAQVLCAQSYIRQGERTTAQDYLRKIDEEKLRSIAELVLRVQGDLGHFLLAKAELEGDKHARLLLVNESRAYFRFPLARSKEREHYLQNLYYAMTIRRAELATQAMGISASDI